MSQELFLLCIIFFSLNPKYLEVELTFTTDEPAIGCIECVSPDLKERFIVCETNFSLNHTLHFNISGSYDIYYCIISAEDEAGNVNETGGILKITHNKTTIQPTPVANLPFPQKEKSKVKSKTEIVLPNTTEPSRVLPPLIPLSSTKRIPGFDLTLAVLILLFVLVVKRL